MVKGGYKEIKGKRSIFGKFVLLCFLGFNVLMVTWLITSLGAVGEGYEHMSQAEQAGTALGAGIGMMMIFFVWALGDVILGIPLLLTRPSKTLVPVDE